MTQTTTRNGKCFSGCMYNTRQIAYGRLRHRLKRVLVSIGQVMTHNSLTSASALGRPEIACYPLYMRKHRKFAALKLASMTAGICLSLTGCIGKAFTGIDNAYPKNWEPSVGAHSATICADLSGNYQDLGDFSYLVKDSHSNSLSNRFTRIDWQAQSVRPSLPDSDTLLVEILEGKSVKHAETLRESRGDFGGYSKSNVRLYLRHHDI